MLWVAHEDANRSLPLLPVFLGEGLGTLVLKAGSGESALTVARPEGPPLAEMMWGYQAVGEVSMRFRITHETIYGYDRPVSFGAHLLRLTPRSDSGRVIAQEFEFEPTPSTRCQATDRWGNSITEVTFAGEWSRLTILSRLSAETQPRALEALAGRAGAARVPTLPWGLHEDESSEYCDAGGVDPTVRQFAQQQLSCHGPSALEFLDGLNLALHDRTDRCIRWSGAAQDPAVTLALRSGACRDLTVLFLAVCRCLGMAARFVSGYQAREQTLDGQRHLHGWPEVHFPGIGWCGWDPMHGVRAGEGHLALAAGPIQAGTMPVEGGFFGAPTLSTLDVSLRIATH